MVTLADYMHWLKSNGGKCSTGIQADDVMGMVPAVRLTAANGKSVVFVADQKEELLPLSIDYLDRKLEVASPFRSLPKGGH